jgi:hypothetical protein
LSAVKNKNLLFAINIKFLKFYFLLIYINPCSSINIFRAYRAIDNILLKGKNISPEPYSELSQQGGKILENWSLMIEQNTHPAVVLGQERIGFSIFYS